MTRDEFDNALRMGLDEIFMLASGKRSSYGDIGDFPANCEGMVPESASLRVRRLFDTVFLLRKKASRLAHQVRRGCENPDLVDDFVVTDSLKDIIVYCLLELIGD